MKLQIRLISTQPLPLTIIVNPPPRPPQPTPTPGIITAITISRRILWREGFQNSKKLYVIIQNKMRANFSYGKKDMNLTGVGGGVGLVGGRAGRMGGGQFVIA